MSKTLKVAANVPSSIPFQKEYSAIFRFAYERWGENKTEVQIRYEVKSRWKKTVNCWIAQNAIKTAKQEYDAHQAQLATGQRKKKVIWGGRKNFEKRTKDEISKAEYDKARLRPVIIQGEVQYDSNRLFDFSKLKDNIIIYKPNRRTKVEYSFITGKNQDKEIQYLINNIGVIPIQVLLKEGQICFIYDQEKAPITKNIKDRILGIDMNTSNMGATIVDFKNGKEILVKTNIFKISKATRKNDSKRNHETKEIAHNIIKMARHYRCSEVSMEELTMGAVDVGLGKNFNRLCNNEWNRELFQWTIKKLCDKYNIKCKMINCAYSSTIGNILHRDLPDPCAAAWEIARRGKYQYVKELCMYPKVDFSKIDILNRWKKEGVDLTKSIDWKELHDKLKDSGLKYRVALESLKSSVRDFCCMKTGIIIYSNFSIP